MIIYHEWMDFLQFMHRKKIFRLKKESFTTHNKISKARFIHMNKYDPLKHSKSHQDRQSNLPQVRRTRGANTFLLRNPFPTFESLIRLMQIGFS